MQETGGDTDDRYETGGLKERREPRICRVVGRTQTVDVDSEWHRAKDQQATEESEQTNPTRRFGSVGTSKGSDEHENAAADLD